MSNDYIDKCFSILPYIPTHVREYLCNYEESTLQPNSLECYGVVMMVDVSGMFRNFNILSNNNPLIKIIINII